MPTKKMRPSPTATGVTSARGSMIITLADRAFSVPPLSIRYNREVYPLCVALTNAGLLDRLSDQGVVNLTAGEIDQLAEIALQGALAADQMMTREAFDQMPVTPAELIDAFIIMRIQTGGWVMPARPQA